MASLLAAVSWFATAATVADFPEAAVSNGVLRRAAA
jgi:hypothetical protein